jgi:hypothetical protein
VGEAKPDLSLFVWLTITRFINQNATWRWTYYFLIIWSFLQAIALVCVSFSWTLCLTIPEMHTHSASSRSPSPHINTFTGSRRSSRRCHLGTGTHFVFTSSFTYLIVAYRPIAASALASNSAMRSTFAAVFPLFAIQMYHSLGTVSATVLLVCLAAVMTPLP